MSTFYNHTYFPLADFASHNPAKYRKIVQYGGLYTGRVLACSSPGDIVQLDPRLRKFYPAMIEHLESVGLKTAARVLFSSDPSIANNYPDHRLSVYTFNDTFHALQPDRFRLEAAELCNNKNSFIAYCVTANIPVPPTYVSQYGPLHPLSAVQLPAYVKAARSAAGISIYRTQNRAELAAALTRVGTEYQVQQEVQDVTAFINVHYRADANGVHHVATTTQLLNDFRHMGSVYPSEYDGHHITDSLAAKLQARGLRDIFGFDTAVTADGRMFILECNARWSASTYPIMIAKRLRAKAWTACKLDTRMTRPQDLQLGELVYNPSTQNGIVVIDFGMLAADQASEREITCLLIGTPEEQSELRIRLEERLRNSTSTQALRLLP